MPRKRKITSLGTRCRFCLARDACMSELFVDWLRPKLADLEKCSSIEIMDKPNYPRNICYVCLYKLEMWNDFKLQFLKTNKTLLTHFKVDKSVTEENKVLDGENTADDLFSDDNKKRSKIDIPEVNVIDTCQEVDKSIKPVENSIVHVDFNKPENEHSDVIAVDEEQDKKITSDAKIQQSDTSNVGSKKSNRPKKIEREAFTKRWVERKNALIAATGEVPSESDSDNGSQLSPVQKARAKSNNEKDMERQRRKIEKALKNLEMNVTDKYKIKQEDIIDKERKTRSRKLNTEDTPKVEPSKTILSEVVISLPKSLHIDKKVLQEELRVNTNNKEKEQEPMDVDKEPIIVDELEEINIVNEEEEEKETDHRSQIIEVNKEEEEKEKEKVEKIEEEKEEEKIEEEKEVEEIEEERGDEKVEKGDKGERKEEEKGEEKREEKQEEKKEEEKEEEQRTEESSTKQLENTNIIDNDIEIIEVENDVIETDVLQNNKDDSTFKPQLVTSEVSVGNATYVITTTLDVPDALSSKSDISFKTNGISIDATSQDGKKIDLLSAVELQKAQQMDANLMANTNNGNNKTATSDIQKCFKIEIEGMEVEALQRVQLELAHFINADIRQRLLEDRYTKKITDLKHEKFKDSYESLNYQLKTIIENVLRSNYESDKLNPSMLSNHNKISHEFVKAAAHSPVFQPKIAISRLNIGKLCKTYKINNLHILEDVKRKRGLVGPLSRTLGKRKHVLPKKYQDFSLNMTTSVDPDNEKKKTAAPTKSASNKTTTTPSTTISNIILEAVHPTIKMIPQVNTPDVIEDILPKPVEPPTIKPLPSIMKELPSIKMTPAVVEKVVTSAPALNKASKITITKTTGSSNSSQSASRKSTVNNTTACNTTVTAIKSINNTAKQAPVQKCHYRHLCGLCHMELHSKEEAEAHVKNHKIEMTTKTSMLPSTASKKATPKNSTISSPRSVTPSSTTLSIDQSQKSKPKLMRCKRCQAIVEARHVKTHVCNSVKFNCTLCDCRFGAEHLLAAHLETHSQYKKKEKFKGTLPSTNPLKEKQRMLIMQESAKMLEQDTEEDLEDMLTDKEPQGYSCFVCDKIFVDEEQMKDHLQMHCEEVSDEGNDKGFQCAFCGDKFQTEESLETHVGNHLLEDGDEKINMLINMDMRREKQKKSMFRCEQCSESFSSSLLLAMHLPLHEEEEAIIAEYDKQDVEQEHHVCTICDEIFESAEELSEHLDVHNGNAHVCILCEKPFSSIRDLQEHVSTHL